MVPYHRLVSKSNFLQVLSREISQEQMKETAMFLLMSKPIVSL